MAFIDWSDDLLAGDLVLIRHMRPKVRNILEHRFIDVPRLYFDISIIIGKPLQGAMISSILMDHLSDFGVPALHYSVSLDQRLGIFTITINSHSSRMVDSILSWDEEDENE